MGENPKAEDNPVTPAMIEAGRRRLDELFDATVEAGSDVGLMCIPGGWAEAVYRAMSDASGQPETSALEFKMSQLIIFESQIPYSK